MQDGVAQRSQSLNLPVEADVVARFRPAMRQDDKRQILGFLEGRQGQVGVDVKPVGRLVIDGLLLRDPLDRQFGIVVGHRQKVAGGQVAEPVTAGIALIFGIDDHFAWIFGEACNFEARIIAHDLGQGFVELFQQGVEIVFAFPVVLPRKAGQASGRGVKERTMMLCDAVGIERRPQHAVGADFMIVAVDEQNDGFAVAAKPDDFGPVQNLALELVNRFEALLVLIDRRIEIKLPYFVELVEVGVGKDLAVRRDDEIPGVVIRHQNHVAMRGRHAEAIKAHGVFILHLIVGCRDTVFAVDLDALQIAQDHAVEVFFLAEQHPDFCRVQIDRTRNQKFVFVADKFRHDRGHRIDQDDVFIVSPKDGSDLWRAHIDAFELRIGDVEKEQITNVATTCDDGHAFAVRRQGDIGDLRCARKDLDRWTGRRWRSRRFVGSGAERQCGRGQAGAGNAQQGATVYGLGHVWILPPILPVRLHVSLAQTRRSAELVAVPCHLPLGIIAGFLPRQGQGVVEGHVTLQVSDEFGQAENAHDRPVVAQPERHQVANFIERARVQHELQPGVATGVEPVPVRPQDVHPVRSGRQDGLRLVLPVA